MTERIKELIEQATTKESFYPAGCNGHHEDRYYFDKEKFAELIVRECLAQVWYTREDSINGNISEVIKERMKEHFGVEE